MTAHADTWHLCPCWYLLVHLYTQPCSIWNYSIIICIQNETGLSQHKLLGSKIGGRYELIQVTWAEIILSHFESIWWYFSHTFHYFTDEISWKSVKVEHGCWPFSFAHVLRSRHVDYAHCVSYVCTPYASNIGDVPEYVYPSRIYVRQWGGYHIHHQGEMCFERSTVSHNYSVKRCENIAYYCSYTPVIFLV